MRVRTTAFVCLLVVAGAVIVAGSQTKTSSKDIALMIDRHPGWTGDNYEQGGTMLIRCRVKDISRKAVTFILADHDDYHGTLPYPVFMSAKVTDLDGNVLTRSVDSPDGWWSQYIRWSTFYREMPGDRVTLKPQEEVVRIVPLNAILEGNPSLQDGLKAGDYFVELKLEDIVSNSMRIRVVPKK